MSRADDYYVVADRNLGDEFGDWWELLESKAPALFEALEYNEAVLTTHELAANLCNLQPKRVLPIEIWSLANLKDHLQNGARLPVIWSSVEDYTWRDKSWTDSAPQKGDYVLIEPDFENNAEEWWDMLRTRYPIIGDALTNCHHVVVAAKVLKAIMALPGYNAGPAHAKTPILNFRLGEIPYRTENGEMVAIVHTLA